MNRTAYQTEAANYLVYGWLKELRELRAETPECKPILISDYLDTDRIRAALLLARGYSAQRIDREGIRPGVWDNCDRRTDSTRQESMFILRCLVERDPHTDLLTWATR